MALVAAYYRSSSSIQKNSIEMQKSKAFEKALSNSVFIDREYIDESVSARKCDISHRPQLNQLLQDIIDGRIHELYVYKRDRLARKAYEYLEIYQILKKYHINVVFTSEEHSIHYTPEGELFEFLMAALIEDEGDRIIERLQASQRARFLNENYIGNLPYGYYYDKDTEVFDHVDEEVKVITKIYLDLVKGESPKEIANTLNNSGLLCRRKKWSASQILRLAKNETYKGIRIYGKKTNDPVIKRFARLQVIDGSLWNKANEKLKQWEKPVKKRKKREFLLDKLVYCKECGKQLKTGYKGYQCLEHGITANKELLEKLVYEQCKNHFTYLLTQEFESLFLRYKKQNLERIEKHLRTLKDEFRKIESKLFDMIQGRFDSTLSYDEEFITKVDLMMIEYQNCEKAIDDWREEGQKFEEYHSILKEAMNEKSGFRAFDNLDFDKKQMLLNDILKRVELSKFDLDLTLKQPFKGIGLKEVISDDVRFGI